MITGASKLREGCVEACPACPHRKISMAESLAQKQAWIRKRLFDFSELIEPISSVPDENRWHYRKKVCLAAEHNGKDWNFGVRKREIIIPIHDCPVQDKQVNQNIQFLSSILPEPEKFPLAYFIQSGKQLTLVLKCREMPGLDWMSDQVQNELQQHGVEGLWLHLFPSTGKKVTGKGGWYLIFGEPRSKNENGLIYGPQSFQQALHVLYIDSLNETLEFLNPCNDYAVIDLYCGIGASLKKWIHSGAEVIGIELSGEALECASINAPEAQLLRGKCAERIPQLTEFAVKNKTAGKKILLYANPPRTGLEAEILAWIANELKPERMAYLSCSAGTLHRDLNFLQSQGWVAKRIIPYDFIPQTLHVEMLALLESPNLQMI